MRYSPGSFVVVVSPSIADRDRFVNRVIEEHSALLSVGKVRNMLQGRVPEEDLESRSKALLDATIQKRLEKGLAVVLPVDSLDPAEREPYVRIAHGFRRPRHLILIETAKENVAEEDAAALNELRTAVDSGELGNEGFQTAMRLGGASVGELKRIVFRPAPRDDD